MSDFKVGDVVIIKEAGWGFPYEDLGKVVKLVAQNSEGEWTVEAHDCRLETERLDDIWSNSFGENPVVLLNVFDKPELEQNTKSKPDAVNSPKHYSVFEDVEAIQVIAGAMTEQQFYGYCLGNILKYRLRAGGKDDVMQELGKADKYQELYNQHKHLCRG